MVKYKNSLPPVPVPDQQIRDELHDLQISGRFLNDSGDKSPVEIWKALFPKISPHKLHRTLQNEVGRDSAITLRLFNNKNDSSDKKLECTIFIDRKDAELRPGTHTAHITFAAPNDGVCHDDICLKNARVINSDQQGKRLLAGSLREMAGMLKEQGTQNIALIALEVGGYAWVKYGFRPTDQREWEMLKTSIVERIKDGPPPQICIPFSKDGGIYPITAKSKKAILNVLKSDDPADIIHLTELDTVIGKQGNDHEITVGKALLMKSWWKGVLPLDEKDRGYQQFMFYTGAENEKGQNK